MTTYAEQQLRRIDEQARREMEARAQCNEPDVIDQISTSILMAMRNQKNIDQRWFMEMLPAIEYRRLGEDFLAQLEACGITISKR
jgi:hypothetical protein